MPPPAVMQICDIPEIKSSDNFLGPVVQSPIKLILD